MYIGEFPDYYELLLNDHIKRSSKALKTFSKDLHRFMKTLRQGMGKDLEYDRRKAALYHSFYWPVNFFKYMYVLEVLNERSDIFRRGKISITDLACGTGAFLSALVFYCNKNRISCKVEYTGIDASSENLRILKKVFLGKEFRDFIEFPFRYSIVNADVMNMKNIEKSDLVVSSNLFTELSREEQHEFFITMTAFLKENGIFAYIDPVNRKKNSDLNTYLRGFLFENPQYNEIAPFNIEEQSDESAVSAFFETIYFDTPEAWKELGIYREDTDFIYHVITNKEAGVTPHRSLPAFTDEPGAGKSVYGMLMTKDVYRKSKPPWRFKISDGKNGIRHTDILLYDVGKYKKLMNSRIGDVFCFCGDLEKDTGKKRKSRFVLKTNGFEKV